MSSAFAQRVTDALGPAFVEQAGPLLPALLDALTSQLADVNELLTVPDAPLAAAPLADLATSPYPQWLGQLAGVRVPTGLDLPAARAFITGRGVSRRGTPAAIRAAAAGSLTGTRRVDLIERQGSPWRVLLVTYAGQTPDPAATLAAALSEKPVGLVLEHVVATGQVYAVTTAEGLTYGQHTATGRTYAQRSQLSA